MKPTGNSGKMMDTKDKISVNTIPVWSMAKFVSEEPGFLQSLDSRKF
jgi:hypothetical protein